MLLLCAAVALGVPKAVFQISVVGISLLLAVLTGVRWYMFAQADRLRFAGNKNAA